MIPKSCDSRQGNWRDEFARAITDPEKLLRALNLDEKWLADARKAAALFSLRVPLPYLARIRPNTIDDPLLRQVLPLVSETRAVAGYGSDPVGDLAAQVGAGVLQKYQGRALVIATGACAIHCRYCFRRHFPYEEAHAAGQNWRAVLDYTQHHPDIHELILSGGDPLALSDTRLTELMAALQKQPHIRRVRIHTRLPVVIPSRVDEGLLAWIRTTRQPIVMVLHINHAQEIDDAVVEAAGRLREAGVTLLNQAVLLAGVNDALEAQVTLSESLFDAGILPYYLHILDPVAGAAHFAVVIERAQALAAGMATRLPGYLVPKLVREQPGARAKVQVAVGTEAVNGVE